MSNVDTGHTYQGRCEPQGAVGYEPETVYEARVETGDRIYFMFSHRKGVKRVSIMRSDIPNGNWLEYLIIPNIDLHYYVPNGTWMLRTSLGCNPVWLFKVGTKVKEGLVYSPIIAKAPYKPSIAEIHHKSRWGGDYYGTTCTPAEYVKEEVRRALKWYEKAKKEVKSEMLQLITVILFNRETKKVDFRKDIVAPDSEEAYLLAVQEYGKYDPKVHVKASNCILSFVEIKKEE